MNNIAVRNWIVGGICALLMAATPPANAQNFQTKAKQALLMDFDSGSVLYQKNADQFDATCINGEIDDHGSCI